MDWKTSNATRFEALPPFEGPAQPNRIISSCVNDRFARQYGKGGCLPSVRFIRFARLAVLVADLSTIAFVTLIFGWQTIVFLRVGSWPPLALSVAFSAPKPIDGDVYQTASIGGMGDGPASSLFEMLLQLPLISVLLVGAAMLTAFYAWLYKIEKAPR